MGILRHAPELAWRCDRCQQEFEVAYDDQTRPGDQPAGTGHRPGPDLLRRLLPAALRPRSLRGPVGPTTRAGGHGRCCACPAWTPPHSRCGPSGSAADTAVSMADTRAVRTMDGLDPANGRCPQWPDSVDTARARRTSAHPLPMAVRTPRRTPATFGVDTSRHPGPWLDSVRTPGARGVRPAPCGWVLQEGVARPARCPQPADGRTASHRSLLVVEHMFSYPSGHAPLGRARPGRLPADRRATGAVRAAARR
jgi:hypothetical protein